MRMPPYRDVTVGALLTDLSCALPDAPALLYADGPRFTFAELEREARTIARGLMAAGVEGAGVIATDAAISIVIGIVKISVFGLAGVITAQVIAFALLIGIVALPGAFLARAFVERMPVHVHTAILDAVVLLGGTFLVWGAFR